MASYKLLLADDSLTIQKVVELVLADENFEIKAVSDGEQALEAIGSFGPDIVLADIDMPKLNGYQLCEKIKNGTASVHIPVILLAGAFEPFDEEHAKSVGADDNIIKPFESEELISKVKSLLAGVKPASRSLSEEIRLEAEGKDVFQGMADTELIAAVREVASVNLTQNAPRIIEDVTRQLAADIMQSLHGEILAAVSRIVPEVAETIIKKEIEKITAHS